MIKTTGSKFENFIRDEYTTLVEVNDRIFSTAVDLEYSFGGLVVRGGVRLNGNKDEMVDVRGGVWEEGKMFEDVARRARRATLSVFAVDESASVQVSDL